MEVADASILLQAKENIEPLRGGRNLPQLCNAVQAETSQSHQMELKKMKEYYEMQLRAYKGDDPLSIWDEYINWLEQCYPKQGQKSQLRNLLRKCVNKFKDEEKYNNDARFVKLCIKFAEVEGNKLELLKQIGGHGIGMKSAYYYIALADELTMNNSFKKANIIYERGKANNVQPMELLEEAQMRFQLFVGRHCLSNGTETFKSVLEQNGNNNGEQYRHPYNALKSYKIADKEVVPSVRTGDHVAGPAGKMLQNISENKLKKNKPLLIYQGEDENEEGDHEQLCGVKKTDKIHHKKITTKENMIKSSGKISMQRVTGGINVPTNKPLPFQVHVDDTQDNVIENKPTNVVSSVLKTRKVSDEQDKQHESVDMWNKVENVDSKQKLMFCSEQVYAGDGEFQFEELRAIVYRRRRDERKVINQQPHELQKMSKVKKRERKPYARCSMNEVAKKNVLPAVSRKTICGGDEFKTCKDEAKFDQSSMTIHTKEAMNEIQNIWLSEQSRVDDPPKKSILKGAAQQEQFQVFVDESCMDNINVENVQRECGVPFVKGPDLLENLGPEEKENFIPPSSQYPVGSSSRRVTGVLTVSDNVPFRPLSEEDEVPGEEDDEVVGIEPLDRTGATETWNLTAKFKAPKFHSTPTMTLRKMRPNQNEESFLMQEIEKKQEQDMNKLEEKMSSLTTLSEYKVNKDPDQQKQNLSTIVETSRENYKSSSSSCTFGRQSTIGLSKTTAITPFSSQTTGDAQKFDSTPGGALFRTRLTSMQNLTGYEASSELSYNPHKTSSSANNESDACVTKSNKCTRILEVLQEDVDEIDPFDTALIKNLLDQMSFPQKRHTKGYNCVNGNLPNITIGGSVALGKKNVNIRLKIGEGAYAKVFKATSSGCADVVLKVQKPAWAWEFYISREIQLRLKDKNLASGFANIEEAYIYNNGSLLSMKSAEHGDLLSVLNFHKVKEGKGLMPGVVACFTIEMLNIIQHLHACKIIHGDIKPDNFLVVNLQNRPFLQLIDFGRSIDMTLFPDDTTFKRVVTTEGFTCIEMQTGRDWTYQTDLYGLANTAHCMVFGEYMKLVENNGVWNISKKLPRYLAREEWGQFFNVLLNIESCKKIPNLTELKDLFQKYLTTVNIEAQLARLNNILKKK